MDDYLKIQADVQNEIKNYLSDYSNTNQFSLSKIPVHEHTGSDTLQINPKNLLGFPTIKVDDATVAPTDEPINGTIRFLYDGTLYYQWTRINNTWQGTNLDDSVTLPDHFGGSGADGALSITSGTTTIDVGGVAVFVKNYTSISITGTGALAFSNPAAGGTVVMLKSTGNATITSSATPGIDMRGLGGDRAGSDATGLPVGSGGTPGTSLSTAAGGANNRTQRYPATALDISLSRGFQVACGGGGGSTGGTTAGIGGRGGGGLYMEIAGALNFTGSINSSGADGTSGVYTSGTTAPGGGGGGGAGNVVILYNTLTANSGTITSTGGNGGQGGNRGSSGFANVGGGGGGASPLGSGGNGGTGTSSGVGGNGQAPTGLGAGGGGGGGGDGGASNGAAGGTTMGGFVSQNYLNY